MIPHELQDGSLTGVIPTGNNRRTLVHPQGPYLWLEHQTNEPTTRWSPGGWKTASEVDFIDPDPIYLKALQEALEIRNEEVKLKNPIFGSA